MKELLLISLFIFIFCSGCSLYSPYARVIVKVPEIPPEWEQRFGGVSFCIEYPDLSWKNTSVPLPCGENSCTIRLPKMRNWPVIALPNGDGFPLPPAGALYPWHLDDAGRAVLSLSWDHGFTAALLRDCCGNGYDITMFNAVRLSEEVLEVSGGDPWRLDYSFIAEKIINNRFRVNYIKTLPCVNVEFLPGAGKWFFSSPFSPLYETEQGGVVCFKDIPVGFHRLFHCSRPVWYEMYITEQEAAIVYYGDGGDQVPRG